VTATPNTTSIPALLRLATPHQQCPGITRLRYRRQYQSFGRQGSSRFARDRSVTALPEGGTARSLQLPRRPNGDYVSK
jgi:hypothetical protein